MSRIQLTASTRRGPINGRAIADLVALLALLVSLLAAGTGSASAQRASAVDSSGDVTGILLPITMEEPIIYTPHPEMRYADITNTLVRHTLKRVIVRSDFVNLRRLRPTLLEVRVLTDSGVIRQAELVRTPTGSTFRLWTLSGSRVHCSGVRHVANPTKDFMRMSIPRRCFGNPAWIETRVAAYPSPEWNNGGDEALLDDSRQGTIASMGFPLPWPRLSPG